MSLLTKAKVITTPTAYSDGILHSVKPEIVLGSNIYDNNINEAVNSGTWTDNGDGTFTVTGTGSPSFAVGVRDANAEYLTDGKKYKWSVEGENVSLAVYNSSFGVVASGTSPLYFTAESISRLYISATDGTSATYSNILIQEATDADFTFTRNSSATRVGEDGYIQDVQIIGGELVQNGDFEEIGSELVTNGSFDTDSDWNFIGTANISGGTANFPDTTSSYVIQTVVPLSVKQYRIQYEITATNGGGLRLGGGSSAFGTYTLPNTLGTHIVYLQSIGTENKLQFHNGSSFIGSIDNVSVKEVGQNWTVSNSDATHYVEFSEDGARFVSDTTSPILTLGQGISLTSGNKYRFSIRLRNNGGTGNIKVQATGLEFMPNILDGTYTQDIIPTTNQSAVSFYRNGSDVDLYIEDFSIKEVTDDTNLPRINYEGFSYEETLGEQLLSDPVDLINDFTVNALAIIVDSNTFTTSGNSLDGIKKVFLTIGKKYKLQIYGSTTSNGFTIGDVFASGNEYGSGFGTHYFTAVSTGLWLRQNTAGTTDITSFQIQEVIGDLPIYGSGKGHFLLEGQSTNLVPYSEDFSSNLLVNSSILSNNTISPDGTQNATLLKEDTNSGNHALRESANTSIATDDSQYVISFYAKSNGRNIRFIDDGYAGSGTIVNFNLSTGETFSNGSLVIDSGLYDYGNDWWRCWAVIDKSSAAQSVFRFSLRLLGGVSNDNDSYSGDGLSGVWIWGKQAEDAITYATSYIPTNGSAVTRAAETCNNAGNADLFDSEGVLYAEIAALANDGTFRLIGLSDGTTSNRIYVGLSSITNRIDSAVTVGGINQCVLNYVTPNNLIFQKAAIRFSENDFSLWIDGVQVVTDTSGSVPTGLNELIFSSGSSSSIFYGKTKMVGVFPYLSNDEMECLTGEGYGSFEAMALANNYTII